MEGYKVRQRAGNGGTTFTFCVPPPLEDGLLLSRETLGVFDHSIVMGEVTLPSGALLHTYVAIITCDKEWGYFDPAEVIECRVGNTVFPFIIPKTGTATCAPLRQLTKKDERPEGFDSSTKVFTEILALIADILGKTTFLLHPRAAQHHEPFPNEDGVIHVFAGMAPGRTGYTNPHTLFGIDVLTNDMYMSCAGPFSGRGIILSDGKTDIVQIVGNNIYLLYDPYELAPLGQVTMQKIFSKMIALAIDHWVDSFNCHDENADLVFLTRKNVAEIATNFFHENFEWLTDNIHRQKEKIDELQERILLAQRQFVLLNQIYQRQQRGQENEKKLSDQFVADYNSIVAHPLVAVITQPDKKHLDVHTKTIHIAHDGNTYRIGEFVIRLGSNASIAIWTRRSYHPEHIPHPHIPLDGNPCFGNVGSTITEAIAEMRLGDATEYILDWISNGYTPELVVHHKVEEWPIETSFTETSTC